MARASAVGAIAGLLAALAALGALASCQSSHGRQEVRSEDCVVCHQPEYDMTTSPPHPGLFATTCADCHGTDAWAPAVAIRHDWFVLRSRHTEIACVDCHTVGFRPGDTPASCDGCHRDDYDAALAPPHAGYPLDCAQCHDEAGWRPSTFVHTWPLDGAHRLTPCQSCHVGTPPVYAGTPTTCVGCHRSDYDTSPYPGHATFPLSCQDCHTTAAWSPAIGGAHPEASFPIASGKHFGFACLDCHDPALGSSVDGMNTDCVGCHTGEHTRARMDNVHEGEPDYPAGAAPPNFCLTCHPDGTKD